MPEHFSELIQLTLYCIRVSAKSQNLLVKGQNLSYLQTHLRVVQYRSWYIRLYIIIIQSMYVSLLGTGPYDSFFCLL